MINWYEVITWFIGGCIAVYILDSFSTIKYELRKIRELLEGKK